MYKADSQIKTMDDRGPQKIILVIFLNHFVLSNETSQSFRTSYTITQYLKVAIFTLYRRKRPYGFTFLEDEKSLLLCHFFMDEPIGSFYPVQVLFSSS